MLQPQLPPATPIGANAFMGRGAEAAKTISNSRGMHIYFWKISIDHVATSTPPNHPRRCMEGGWGSCVKLSLPTQGVGIFISLNFCRSCCNLNFSQPPSSVSMHLLGGRPRQLRQTLIPNS
jgi:hypothetical protein